ncbi:MAG TPA: FGGY-family carbohydrate kinase [Vicinamibacterales bacterium]|nr:FGGY-family carbohydrate kinase [Vicinamibacterales bacterium]
MKLYIGLDSSTQSLTAIVIEVDGAEARVVFDESLPFDDTFPQYGTEHGVLSAVTQGTSRRSLGEGGGEAFSSPVMWADALDTMMRRIAESGLDIGNIAAISGSAQQHGSVYLNASAASALGHFDASRSLAEQVAPMLSRQVAPIWMDSSTGAQCVEIAEAVGGQQTLARHTGSRAFERFTGPQIRKFAQTDPAAYAATDRIHLVSSFMASLLAGTHASIDPGDGSGMNLMDLKDRQWWPDAVNATAPALAVKLPAITESWTVAGVLSPFWQTRFGLPAAKVVAWSGDNPCSLIGVGLVREGRVAISLGTSDTVFGLMKEPRVDPTGTGHVFGAPTGDYMGLTCFSNGSLARERVQDAFGFTWTDFSRALDTTPAGNQGRVLIPWFVPEITPAVTKPAVHRYRLNPDDPAANVRAVVEAQQMAMALHSQWMKVTIDVIHATGGAAANREILQVMADVFGAEVYRSTVSNSAALGAALRAWHADTAAEGSPLPWSDITALAQPGAASPIAPNPKRHAVYRELLPIYEACEAHALGRGPDPIPALERFAGRT